MRRLFAVVLVVATVSVGMLIGGTASATESYKGIVITGYSFDPNRGILTVRVKTYGWKMYPGLIGSKSNKPDGGHWLLYVNAKVRARSATAQATVTKLAKGTIRFFVALANNDNSAVKGAKHSDTLSEVVR